MSDEQRAAVDASIDRGLAQIRDGSAMVATSAPAFADASLRHPQRGAVLVVVALSPWFALGATLFGFIALVGRFPWNHLRGIEL